MLMKATLEKTSDLSAVQLAPVGRETVQDRVYTEMRRALIGGLFEPGQVLTIRGLADALATSTMPVREAVGRLITEKALEALPNRSARVPPITKSPPSLNAPADCETAPSAFSVTSTASHQPASASSIALSTTS